MTALKRVIAHWAVTKYKATDLALQHYHFVVEGDGNVVAGKFKPEANIKPVSGKYAAHTLNCNTGSIGISCAAMHGAKSPKEPGPYPVTEVQFDAMCRKIAELCDKYDIDVTPKTVLSHAEVEANLGKKQRGKWDIAVLPFAGLFSAEACGNLMRSKVKAYRKQIKPGKDTQVASLADPTLLKTKRFWTWASTGLATPLAAFGGLDWRVQLALVVVVVGFAVYAITSMPQVRKAVGLSS